MYARAFAVPFAVALPKTAPPTPADKLPLAESVNTSLQSISSVSIFCFNALAIPVYTPKPADCLPASVKIFSVPDFITLLANSFLVPLFSNLFVPIVAALPKADLAAALPATPPIPPPAIVATKSAGIKNDSIPAPISAITPGS